MAIEVASFIHQLIAANPQGNTPKSEGDDHLRLIKTCLLNSFPNIAGVVNASHTELNHSVGVTSAIQDQINTKAPINNAYLTGAPTTPTPAQGSNNTQIANTRYVDEAFTGDAYPLVSGRTLGETLTHNGAIALWRTAVQTNLTFQIGVGGTFPTLKQALIEVYAKYYPKMGRITSGSVEDEIYVTLNLMSGYVQTESIDIWGLDLSWIKITGSDAETLTTAAPASLVTHGFVSGRMGLFTATHGGKLPIIDQVFTWPTPGYNMFGIVLRGMGTLGVVGANGGFKNSVNGVLCSQGFVAIDEDATIELSGGGNGIEASFGAQIYARGVTIKGGGVQLYDGSMMSMFRGSIAETDTGGDVPLFGLQMNGNCYFDGIELFVRGQNGAIIMTDSCVAHVNNCQAYLDSPGTPSYAGAAVSATAGCMFSSSQARLFAPTGYVGTLVHLVGSTALLHQAFFNNVGTAAADVYMHQGATLYTALNSTGTPVVRDISGTIIPPNTPGIYGMYYR